MTASNNTRNIERGQSRKRKLIHGVGFNSKRKHKAFKGNKSTAAYSVWRHMIMRCYSAKTINRQPTYIGCTVDSRWHDFQDFADWFYRQPHSEINYHLDKDLLVPNNKVYSPDTCCFVPREINNLLISCSAVRGIYPQGVNIHKPTGKYRAQIRIDGKNHHLGYFDCPNEAHKVYKVAKERNVKYMALKWANRIESNVFDALMKWTLDS